MTESEGKTVLVSYLEKNKRITIPSNSPMSDLEFLTANFVTSFKFESNVSLDITFQKYDTEWKEYIDLEDGDKICHKDKLKAVVTPLLVLAKDTLESSSVLESSAPPSSTLSSFTPKPIVEDSKDYDYHSPIHTDPLSNSSDDEDIANHPKKRKTLPTSDDEGGDEILKPKKGQYRLAKIVKSEEDKIPLPDPFDLPKNFRPDVTHALKAKKMTLETDRAFLSSVAGAMFSYKRYPSGEDFYNVARAIVTKYPFMKSPVGKPYAGIIAGLQNRFKEFRREKKPRKSSSASDPVPATCKSTPKSPSVNKAEKLSVPAGEDEVSFARHNRVLKAEFSKSKPNAEMVKDLMERTFAMRRKDILSQGHSYDPLAKYPFLQVAKHLLDELERIIGKEVIASSKLAWQEYCPKIVSQAKLERGARITKVVTDLPDTVNPVISLCLLCYLLPDSRTKPDHTKVIRLCDSSEDIIRIASKGQSEPYVIVVGTFLESDQIFLVVDKKVLTQVEVDHLPLYLLAAYYVFNICYPFGCNNLYNFLEIALLGLKISVPSSVTNFLSRLA